MKLEDISLAAKDGCTCRRRVGKLFACKKTGIEGCTKIGVGQRTDLTTNVSTISVILPRCN